MAAAPAPKPDEPADPGSDAEGWVLLENLRRRLEDQAAQGRRTQAQVTQLAESIAALVAEQRRRSLWLNVNSFVAYLVFTVLCAAGCYLLYRSRVHEVTVVRDQAIGERDAAVRRADDAAARATAREAADTKAWEVYELFEGGQRSDAVSRLAALRDQPLSKTARAMLAARARDSQAVESDAALKAARAAVKAGRPAEAIKPVEAALQAEPSSPRAAQLHYYLGLGYARSDLDKAIAHLQAAIAGNVEQDDARFQLASALDRSGAYAQARAEYDRFATAHPQSQLAVFAMRRSATLARVVAPAGSAGLAGPSPPAGPGAPAAVPAAPAPAGPGAAAGTPGGPSGASAAGSPAAPAPPPSSGASGGAAPPMPRAVAPWPRPGLRPAPPPPPRAAGSAGDPSADPTPREPPADPR